MDVREKLVELLDEAEEWADHKCDELDCETCCAGKMKGNCVQKLMVDRLISHGVTVQKHGRWLLDGRCSECLENPLTTHKTYCPSCGAKMDLER